jgi:hypothetical protein
MSALRKTTWIETEYPIAAKSVKPVLSVVPTKATPAPIAEPAAPSRGAVLKNMLLFLAAPFVGLVYAVLLPFVGLGMLAVIGAKALLAQPKTHEAIRYAKFFIKMAAVPFVGLACLLALPFAGLATLAWFAGRAVTATPAV